MLEKLRKLEAEGRPIRVGLIGAGAMGAGIAWQIGKTPGMELAFIGDLKPEALQTGAKAYGREGRIVDGGAGIERKPGELLLTTNALELMEADNGVEFDVLVEGTNAIGDAARYCLAAIERKAHVVLMNAEVDLAVGPLLNQKAKANGVIATSDAGDQHGVLVRMMDEIEMWAFDLVQAGNIKGFLNRYATAESLKHEAAKRNLDPVQCCAYTDGTKLNVEMCLVSNSTGMLPTQPGMEGPRLDNVTDVLEAFDFERCGPTGSVDYALGAVPGGGVYVVGYCDDARQTGYLNYYKVQNEGPYWLFYRPYHLCHLETTRAIGYAVFYDRAILTHRKGRVADAYARAKSDLRAGQSMKHGMGGDETYSLIEACKDADPAGRLPTVLLEGEDGKLPAMKRDVAKDQPITYDDVELPDTYLKRLFDEQLKMLRGNV